MNREKIIQVFGITIVNNAIQYYLDRNKHCTFPELIKKCKQLKTKRYEIGSFS